MTQISLAKTIDHAHAAVEVASEKQASDILMLDISQVSNFADFFVVITVESTPQMRTVAKDIEKALKQASASLHHREGTEDSGWVLLDFGDLIVHLFRPEERELYQLDKLWHQAEEVVRIQ